MLNPSGCKDTTFDSAATFCSNFISLKKRTYVCLRDFLTPELDLCERKKC
jgi:hypothetical protein